MLLMNTLRPFLTSRFIWSQFGLVISIFFVISLVFLSFNWWDIIASLWLFLLHNGAVKHSSSLSVFRFWNQWNLSTTWFTPKPEKKICRVNRTLNDSFLRCMLHEKEELKFWKKPTTYYRMIVINYFSVSAKSWRCGCHFTGISRAINILN